MLDARRSPDDALRRRVPGSFETSARGRSIEALKWQVWIGHTLREWRRQAGRDRKVQKAARDIGFNQDQLSKIEWGSRRVDAVELAALVSPLRTSP